MPCEAIGTVSPPANSSGSRNREYWDGIPDSGRASTEPACQNTPASASDSWRRYQTALPSRSSTACRAPPPPPPPPPPATLVILAPHPSRALVPPRPGRTHPEQGPLQVRGQGARHRQGQRPVRPDHPMTPLTPGPRPRRGHPCGRSTYLRMAKSRHAHALGGPHLPRPDPPDDRPGSPEALRSTRAHGLRGLRPLGRQPPRGQPACSSARSGGSRRRATAPSPSPGAARA